MRTSVGHSVLPSISQREKKSGTAAVSLVSNRCSFSPVSWRKRSLDQITSSFSGRKITMGRGALTMVSLVAVSMLQVTESIYLRISLCRWALVRRRYR